MFAPINRRVPEGHLYLYLTAQKIAILIEHVDTSRAEPWLLVERALIKISEI